MRIIRIPAVAAFDTNYQTRKIFSVFNNSSIRQPIVETTEKPVKKIQNRKFPIGIFIIFRENRMIKNFPAKQSAL